MYTEIAIPVPLRTLFTYTVPDELKASLKPGQRVLVPFGKKEVIGFCMRLHTKLPKGAPRSESLKAIKRVIDTEPILDETYRRWLLFAADYYVAPIGQVVGQAVPSYYFETKHLDSKKKTISRPISFESHFQTKSVTLTKEQENIFQIISEHSHEYFPALLRGITGSGKTEVYIKLIRHVLDQGKSALFLVPEIGLTPQMKARLGHHFQGGLLITHSGLTTNQRLHQWQACLGDEPKVMVGTRSALFSPFRNLGLIIIDEEHDSSYKQEERFRYHARDLAVSRAQLLNIPIVMGSATPGLETYFLAKEGRYHYFELKERVGAARLPRVRVIDFVREKERTQLPLVVSQGIHQSIEKSQGLKKQMMIFVGQRGFAQNAFCLSCKTIQVCPNCSVGLKFHRKGNVLKCHYCEYAIPFDEICSQCKNKALTLLGFGTQAVEEEIRSMHPSLRVARLDSDTTSTMGKMHDLLHDFAKHKIDLLIGTQMITKGHDFHNVDFVGVLGVDVHLGLPDFRASERTFQSLVQVAGRCGREDAEGTVLVQSLMPDHMCVRLGVEQDFTKFADRELAFRKELNYPPFSRLIQFRFLSNQEKCLKDFFLSWKPFLHQLSKQSNDKDIQILGPTEMPLAKIRGKHRYHVIFKIRRGLKTKDFVEYVLADIETRRPGGIQTQVDVDAMNLL